MGPALVNLATRYLFFLDQPLPFIRGARSTSFWGGSAPVDFLAASFASFADLAKGGRPCSLWD
jgi:hypothetical protein